MALHTSRRTPSVARPSAELEQLEPRTLLSGTVNVEWVKGLLQITGDGAANSIIVTGGTAASPITVTGADSTNVTGQAVTPSATVTKGIVIRMGNGNDSVVLDGLVANTPVLVDGGDGDNAFVAQHGGVNGILTIINGASTTGSTVTLADEIVRKDLKITTGTGGLTTVITEGSRILGCVSVINAAAGANDFSFTVDDSVVNKAITIDNQDGDADASFTAANLGGPLTITNRAGVDSFTFDTTTLKGALKINTGAGDSSFTSTSTNFSGLFSYVAAAGADTFTMDGTSVTGKFTAAFGLGGTTLSLTQATFGNAVAISNLSNGINGSGNVVRVGGALAIAAGDGHTDLSLDILTVKGNFAFLSGSGHDELDIGGANITGAVTLSGGAGLNEFTLNYLAAKSIAILGGSDSDILAMLAVTTNSLTCDLRDGDNTVDINDTAIMGATTIVTGAGTDTVNFNKTGTAQTVFAKPVKVLLGAGNDTLTLGGAGNPARRVIFGAKALFDGQAGTNTLVENNVLYAAAPVTLNFI